jgi:hypothetical protein
MRSTVLALLLLPSAFRDFAHAQSPTAASQPSTEVAVSGVALASIQPIDDTYVGWPYLNNGLGGIGPGVALGANVTRRRVAASIEFSTGALTVSQEGRLVGDGAVGRLRDKLFSVLAGVTIAAPVQRIQLLAGISRTFGGPTLNHVPVSQRNGDGIDPAVTEGAGTLGFTGGLDVTRMVRHRVAVLGSFRYSHLPRSRRAAEIGVGGDVFRVGIGLRVQLTD